MEVRVEKGASMRGLLLTLTGLMLAGAVAADTVYLRDGRQLWAKKVTKADGKVRLEMPYGTAEFPESEVSYIDYGTAQPASKPAQVESEPLEQAPVKLQPSVRWDLAEATVPEPIVFMLARQRELAGESGDDLSGQLKQWRIAVHEQKRKHRDEWLARDDRRRRLADFRKRLKDADDKARQAKSIYGDTPADQAKKKKLQTEVEQDYYTAAGAWPDPLLSEFLTAVLDLRAGKSKQAEGRFRRCLENESLLAGLHQGRGLALAADKQALSALAEFVACAELWDDSYEPFRLIEETAKDVPGAQTNDPIYRKAQDLLDRYEKPKYASYAHGGISWLMPGRGWQSRDEGLFVPPYERFICRQAIAIPLTEDGVMVVDSAALTGALKIYVQVAPGRLVQATPYRAGSIVRSSTQKVELPLALIRASGAAFTPVQTESPAEVKVDQRVSLRAANAYRVMGNEIRLAQAQVKQVGPEGIALDTGVLPGEGLSAVFDGDKFVGLFTGRVDAEAADCGQSSFIDPAALSAWIAQVKRYLRPGGKTYSSSAGPALKADVEPVKAEGQVFLLYILQGETPLPISAK